MTNNTLRKLELEGNLLGMKSAIAFGKALRINEGLKFLDLDSNQLTIDGQDPTGMYEFIEFLDHNTSMLSLNISNNMLDQKCGELLREKL